jgi:hypothetical protein
MTIGPLELVVIGYAGNRVPDEVGREFAALEHLGAVRLVDLVFVEKAPSGETTVTPARRMPPEAMKAFEGATGDLMDLLPSGEVDQVASSLPPGTIAVAALFEHTWATGIRDTIARTGGFLVGDSVLTRETVEALNRDLTELEVAAD